MHIKRTNYCLKCRRRKVKDLVKCEWRKGQIWTEMQVNKIVDGAGKAAGPNQRWEKKIWAQGGGGEGGGGGGGGGIGWFAN